MHNVEQGQFQNFEVENERQPEKKDNADDQTSTPVVNHITDSVRDSLADSVQETEQEYEIRMKLGILFEKFAEMIQGQRAVPVKVISFYLQAIKGNVNDIMRKLDKMHQLKLQMTDDAGCDPSIKKHYEALYNELEKGDSVKDKDLERLPQLDTQKTLFELLYSGFEKRIKTLQKPVDNKYLRECLCAIVLLERFPEFDECPEFQQGPLSRFFRENRKDIDAICDYFEKSHHTKPHSEV